MFIEKEFRFEACHVLKKEGCDYGKCSNLHGHSYILKVRLFGSVREDGMIMNFTHLKQIVSPIVEILDHSLLNESLIKLVNFYKLPYYEKENLITTCEVMADVIGHIIGSEILKDSQYNNIDKVGITLFETSTSSCYTEIQLYRKGVLSLTQTTAQM